jgi:metal-dependent amidase/aminoacylase/carboxypeptidase family protein
LEIVNLEEFAFESPSKAGMEIESSSSIIVSKEGYLRDIEPTIGGEDFAFLAEVILFTFFLVGQGSGGDEKYHVPRTNYGLHYGLHHPSFALDEEGLPIGVELHANLALR